MTVKSTPIIQAEQLIHNLAGSNYLFEILIWMTIGASMFFLIYLLGFKKTNILSKQKVIG